MISVFQHVTIRNICAPSQPRGEWLFVFLKLIGSPIYCCEALSCRVTGPSTLGIFSFIINMLDTPIV